MKGREGFLKGREVFCKDWTAFLQGRDGYQGQEHFLQGRDASTAFCKDGRDFYKDGEVVCKNGRDFCKDGRLSVRTGGLART